LTTNSFEKESRYAKTTSEENGIGVFLSRGYEQMKMNTRFLPADRTEEEKMDSRFQPAGMTMNPATDPSPFISI